MTFKKELLKRERNNSVADLIPSSIVRQCHKIVGVVGFLASWLVKKSGVNSVM